MLHADWTERVTRPSAATLAWGALIVLAAAAWFVTGARISARLGFDAAAPAVGVIAAAVVAVTIWRWARADGEQVALARGRCPRCRCPLAARHEHARPGALAEGLIEWSCAACGYDHTEPLTCERCAS